MPARVLEHSRNGNGGHAALRLWPEGWGGGRGSQGEGKGIRTYKRVLAVGQVGGAPYGQRGSPDRPAHIGAKRMNADPARTPKTWAGTKDLIRYKEIVHTDRLSSLPGKKNSSTANRKHSKNVWGGKRRLAKENNHPQGTVIEPADGLTGIRVGCFGTMARRRVSGG